MFVRMRSITYHCFAVFVSGVPYDARVRYQRRLATDYEAQEDDSPHDRRGLPLPCYEKRLYNLNK